MGEVGFDRDGTAARWRTGRSPATGAKSESQADFPGKIRPQGVGQVGAVGRGGQSLVFVKAEMVVQEVAVGIAQNRLQRKEAQALFRRRVEQGFDPGRIKGFCGGRPCQRWFAGFGAADREQAATDGAALAPRFDPVAAFTQTSQFRRQAPRWPAAWMGLQRNPTALAIDQNQIGNRSVRGHTHEFDRRIGFGVERRNPDMRFSGLFARDRIGQRRRYSQKSQQAEQDRASDQIGEACHRLQDSCGKNSSASV